MCLLDICMSSLEICLLGLPHSFRLGFRPFFLFFFYSNQDSMVLTQKQKYRSMEQDRKPRDKHMHLWSPAAAAAKSLQLCPTLCDPIDGSPPGFPIPGILQARTLEWVVISFSNAWKWKVKGKSLSHVWLLATPWISAYEAPPSMGFSRQEYWSGVPLPSPLCVYSSMQFYLMCWFI